MEGISLVYLFGITDIILFIIVMALLGESKHMNDNCMITKARMDGMFIEIEKLSDRIKELEQAKQKKIFKKKKEEK